MLGLALLLIFSGDFSRFMTDLKLKPPCGSPAQNVPAEPDQIWSERAGPWLVRERVIQLAPGVAAISGEVLEVGSVLGVRTRPVVVVAILWRGDWQVHRVHCGPEPWPFVITRLTQ